LCRALSPVRFERERPGIPPISPRFSRNPGGFLCSSDFVVEREGIELSLPFCRAKPRYIRKLQTAKPYQRISHQNQGRVCNQSRFNSLSSLESAGERRANLWLEVVTSECYLRHPISTRLTALAGGHRIELSSVGSIQTGANFCRRHARAQKGTLCLNAKGCLRHPRA